VNPLNLKAENHSIIAIVLAVAATWSVAAAQSPEAPAVQKVLTAIKAQDKGQLAVSEEDGRFLRVLVATSKSKRALEIGGASGYSAIWIGMGLRETGGTLVTMEYDPVRAKELADNVKRAGLADIITVIPGDAFANLPTTPGSFDFVFLDAWKKDYKRFLDLMLPRMHKGGLFVAHNVVNKRSEMGDFFDAINAAPGAWSTIVAPSGEGISLTYKARP
jgi:predicted O-methyltransferase YrrM